MMSDMKNLMSTSNPHRNRVTDQLDMNLISWLYCCVFKESKTLVWLLHLQFSQGWLVHTFSISESSWSGHCRFIPFSRWLIHTLVSWVELLGGIQLCLWPIILSFSSCETFPQSAWDSQLLAHSSCVPREPGRMCGILMIQLQKSQSTNSTVFYWSKPALANAAATRHMCLFKFKWIKMQ